MAVSEEQWVAVATELHTTPSRLQARIAEINARFADGHRPRFDRDGEPLTIGEWAMLCESRTYRVLGETVLPNRFLIITAWNGIVIDDPWAKPGEPPGIFETTLVVLADDRDRFFKRAVHCTFADALTRHAALVRICSRTSPAERQLVN